MRETLEIAVAATRPELAAVLRAQGIPSSVAPDERILRLAEEARAIYERLARPAGLLAEVSRDRFASIYPGEGLNAPTTPLDGILPGATHLALFAVTVGQPVCEEIARLFEAHEPALGAMLDSVASEATELASQQAETHYRGHLRFASRLGPASGVLPFSPGYCGWHVSGQRKLFEALGPEAVGITLNESCLMQPLKSISGVLVAAPRETFAFEDDFPFCEDCRTHSCLERLREVREQ